NQDLRSAVAEKRFREDLYYRVNVVPLTPPPLRERREDLPLLAQHFLSRFNERNGTRRTLTHGALERMMSYDFPGNVPELENLVEQAASLARSEEIEADDLLMDQASPPPPPGSPRTLAQEVDAAERRAIEQAIEHNKGALEKAAHDLAVSTTTLWRKMKRLGMRKED